MDPSIIRWGWDRLGEGSGDPGWRRAREPGRPRRHVHVPLHSRVPPLRPWTGNSVSLYPSRACALPLSIIMNSSSSYFGSTEYPNGCQGTDWVGLRMVTDGRPPTGVSCPGGGPVAEVTLPEYLLGRRREKATNLGRVSWPETPTGRRRTGDVGVEFFGFMTSSRRRRMTRVSTEEI